jgi:FkbM family methyltransferase
MTGSSSSKERMYMQLRKIAGEHTIDVDLLPEAPLVLDVGCRDFLFDREILALRPKAKIIALDPDPLIEKPDDLDIVFLRKALTDKPTASVWWQGPGEGAYIAVDHGTYDSGFGWHKRPDSVEVPNVTLQQIRGEYGEYFDLIKLDCEGSEFGLLNNWPGPICTQISVEFHDFVNRERWNDDYYHRLFNGPLHMYDVVQHPIIPIGPNRSLGHWDSLLVLR